MRASLLFRPDRVVLKDTEHYLRGRQHGEIPALLRQNQDLIMKIIVLDRENEQALLRRGLVPPKHLPPAERQRPHFVANLYRRQSR